MKKKERKKYLLKNQDFDKTSETRNGVESIEEELFADYVFEENGELPVDDIFADYKPESERKEEFAELGLFADYVPEENDKLPADDIFADYKPESEIERVNRQLEKSTINEIDRMEKMKGNNTVKEKNSVKSSNFKRISFQKDNRVKRENAPIKDLVCELTKMIGFKVIHKELYGYEDGIYNIMKKEEDLGKFLMRILPEFCQEKIARYVNFKEIFQWLKVIPELQVENFEEEMEKNATYIPFQNGLYDIATGKFLEYSEERLLFYKLKANYLGRDCDLPPVWNNFLLGISPVDKEISTILCQMILNCLLIGNKSKTVALMLPSPNSGKSVLGNALIEIIGREHITTRSFSELSKRFGLANLEGMALNICMEADTNLNKATIRCIKGLTGESYINSEAKGVNHKVIYNNVKLVFGVNNIPILEEMDEAFFNRLQCIPMMYSIPVDKQDKFLLQKLIEEADGFLSWLVNDETTEQFVHNNFSYSYCRQAEELKQSIKERCENNRFLDAENGTIEEFVDLCIEQTGNKKDFISNQILYLAYQAFCKERNLFQICEPKAFSRKFAKFGIGMKSKSYDPKIESKSPLNGFKGIRLIDEVIEFQ